MGPSGLLQVNYFKCIVYALQERRGEDEEGCGGCSGLNFCVKDKQKLTDMFLAVCPLEYTHIFQVINESK